jgi:aminopeptidase N
MFGKVASFEFRYQLRQPVFWIATVVFSLLTFGATVADQVHIGDSSFVHKNSPFAIAQIVTIWTIFFMFVTTAFVANVIVRDEETGFGPIVRTTRLSKFDYLFGRFLGAFAAAAAAFALSALLPIFIGSLMPWVDPETLGPFQPKAYLFAYLVIALPGLLLTSSAFFALATVTRSMMATYLGVVAFLVLWLIGSLWADKPELEKIVALLEPFGSGAYGLATKYWTATERNSLVPAFSGLLLWNRLLVLAVSAGFLVLAYCVFGFGARAGRVHKGRGKALAAAQPSAPPSLAGLTVTPRFDAATAWGQLVARTRLDVRQVLLSPGFVVVLALGLVNSIANLWLANQIYGVGIHPVTRVMIQKLVEAFSLFPVIIAIYYAGDLVWRERDRRTHEIIESTPVPDWAFVLPKTLAIVLVLVATLAVSVIAAILIQLIQGGAPIEIGKYLLWYIVPETILSTLLAALAVFLQVISPHKFLGWGMMVVYMISRGVLPSLGLAHHLYLYASFPPVPLSDMNGMGRFWIGATWFEVYWLAFALILLVLAYALWRRGVETRLTPRLKRLPHRLRGGAGVLALAALLVFLGSGVFIFINTNVWNPYRSSQDEDRWLADYEKTLLGYQTTPQPSIVNVRLDVDIHPDKPLVVTRGTYEIQNKTSQPLREIHVRFPRDLVMRSLSIEGARPKTTYERFNYRIFTFDTPMAPGEMRRMAFETVLTQRGFKNSGDLTSVVDNGTFLNDREIAPQLGMDRQGLLQDRRKRRKYGLPPELRMPKLGTPGADRYNYLGHDADWVTSDIRVTTDADQIPIAPGARISDRVSGGRRTDEFRNDTPMLKFFSIQSARYAVRRQTYKGIDLVVYYDPADAWNVGRMIKAAKAAFDYYQANYSPYQFHQLRFLEFPAFDGGFAQSYAGTVPWSEDLGFIANLPKTSDKIDYVTYVGAHEIAHQWWAHQVIGADEQGSTLLSETLAQYSALMVMKHMYGPDMIRRFLKYELDHYLAARGSDVIPEEPLERVEDQTYVHYNKGALVMYRLQDQIGEDKVDAALRMLLAKYAFKGPPYPTALDLVADFRAVAPPDKQALITDLFEKITLYDLKAVRAAQHKRPDGRWDVDLTISAAKSYSDGQGRLTSALMNETVDIGLFDADPTQPGFNPSKVVQMLPMQITSGTRVIHLIAPRPVKFAGIDPYNMLIDRNADDNVVKVGG